MHIEIHQPELEQRVREQIQSGHFHDVDDLLGKGPRCAPGKGRAQHGRAGAERERNRAALLAVLQASPYRAIDLGRGYCLTPKPATSEKQEPNED